MLAIDMKILNDLEIQLYQYIIQNKDKVVYMTIRELANETHVSTTTVIRLCKKFGCDGFSEFKTRLKLEVNEGKYKINNNEDIIEELMYRLRDTDLNSKIKEAASLIKKYENIILVGAGNSSYVAGYAGSYLANFGKLTIVINSPYHPLTAKSIKNSVAIIFSVSGETTDTIRIAKELKSRGVKIVSVTNSGTSTLSKLCDIVLPYYIQKESYYNDDKELNLNYRDLTSQIPAMYIIERIGKVL